MSEIHRFAAVMADHYAKLTGYPCEVDAVPDGVCVHTTSREAANKLAKKIADRLRVGGGKVETSHMPMLDEEQPAHLRWWFACFFKWDDIK